MKRDRIISIRVNSDLLTKFHYQFTGLCKITLADFLEYCLIQHLGPLPGKEGTETMEEPAAGSLVSETPLL